MSVASVARGEKDHAANSNYKRLKGNLGSAPPAPKLQRNKTHSGWLDLMLSGCVSERNVISDVTATRIAKIGYSACRVQRSNHSARASLLDLQGASFSRDCSQAERQLHFLYKYNLEEQGMCGTTGFSLTSPKTQWRRSILPLRFIRQRLQATPSHGSQTLARHL